MVLGNYINDSLSERIKNRHSLRHKKFWLLECRVLKIQIILKEHNEKVSFRHWPSFCIEKFRMIGIICPEIGIIVLQ